MLDAGFTAVKTYIASGNVVFVSPAKPARVKAELEARLLAYANKPVGVIVRTAAEMQDVLERNPFPNAAPNRTVRSSSTGRHRPMPLPMPRASRTRKCGSANAKSMFHYGHGMAHSKLRIPAARSGTVRNMNTIAKLAGIGCKVMTIAASRRDQLDPAAVAGTVGQTLARHQLDGRPVLTKEHGRILDRRCLNLDAASLSPPQFDLEMKCVTCCIRAVFDRLMIAAHPVSPLSCVEAGQFRFANWIFVGRDCGAENFARSRDIRQSPIRPKLRCDFRCERAARVIVSFDRSRTGDPSRSPPSIRRAAKKSPVAHAAPAVGSGVPARGAIVSGRQPP